MVQLCHWHIVNPVLGNRISKLAIVLEQIHQYLLIALKLKQLKVYLNSDTFNPSLLKMENNPLYWWLW